ncbi:hypothetical protein OH460_09260 [Vibrio sp. Makdt]|uniref:DNA adenine methylase n=1 Tax=Vibrio sp. Makdt TaxID=2998828 RepID=UPI0022CD3DBA|nr:DNA adenine methylase [Vibrio sp. Makdt]MDA0152491.1 hypothetical protein [Vibrio sp. Makdt]
MRTNLRGGMNTPVGKEESFPTWTVDVANESKGIIQDWELYTGCFTNLPTDKPVDVLYLDPPYAEPKTKPGEKKKKTMFTTYAGLKFNNDMQYKVLEFSERFPETTRIIISNSVFDKKLLKAYKAAGFKLYLIKVPRTIAAKAASRKPVEEVIALKNFNTKRVGTLCKHLKALKL